MAKIASRRLNILFACAGRRVALLEAFRRAMAELGVTGRLLAADLTSASAAFHAADEGFLFPPVDSVKYEESRRQMMEMFRKRQADLAAKAAKGGDATGAAPQAAGQPPAAAASNAQQKKPAPATP